MFGLGMSEIIVLGVLALIVIGPKELPELARTIGRFMNELKRSSNILTDEFKHHTKIDQINFDEIVNRPLEVQKAELANAVAEEEAMISSVADSSEPVADPEQLEFHEPMQSDDEDSEEKKPV